MEETKNKHEEDNAKWVTHYCSDHQILLVGEGDFSFSLSLAKSFGSASNIVASSLNSYDDVIKMYKNAKSNLDDLHKLGACLLHEVDATKMKLHSDLKMRKFDRVIFNFPHAGFHGKEHNEILIKMHKAVVLGFFKNARGMLRANGEIHVSHKTTAPFTDWNIEKLGAQCFLRLIECADFKREDYPGYNNKRGHGFRCDKPFPLGKCCTFKFVYNPKAKRKSHMKRNQKVVSRQPWPTSTNVRYSLTDHVRTMDTVPLSLEARNEPHRVYGGWSNYLQKEHCRTMHTVPLSLDARYGGRSNCFPEELGRTTSHRASYPFDEGHSLRDTVLKWSTPTNVGYHPMRDHVRSKDAVPSSVGARNEDYQVYGGRSNYLQEKHGRTMHSVPLSLSARYGGRSNCFPEELGRTTSHRASYPFDEGHSLRDTLLKWSTSTNVGYHPMRNHVRSMDAVPSSLGARNEGYFSNVYGGNSNYYWQQETAAQRASCHSFGGVRSDFDRFIARVPGKFVQSELHRMNILMQERRVFVES